MCLLGMSGYLFHVTLQNLCIHLINEIFCPFLQTLCSIKQVYQIAWLLIVSKLVFIFKC
jgi:hypothetical protein